MMETKEHGLLDMPDDDGEQLTEDDDEKLTEIRLITMISVESWQYILRRAAAESHGCNKGKGYIRPRDMARRIFEQAVADLQATEEVKR